ncbi:MAG TPA: PIG-L family deacetylase [Dehalococcoidia bacterium]|nr:PIG-L family deacetylase [Dehalococcoidia bacterium]HIK99326.1 PIG-L family deacetylase [Dehalococcoidia bacterium]
MTFTVAHQDDETFGMGSTISHYAASGVEVHVDCATQGEFGEIAPESEAIPETLVMQSCRLLRKCSAFLDCLDADRSPDVRCRSGRRGDRGCVRRLPVGRLENWCSRVKPRTYTRCRLTVITTSPASTAITAAAR